VPIFDQGYQHWKGPLAGHAWRWLAIARHGVRVQLKNRILRVLLILAWLPALTLVVAVALWGLVEQKSAGVLGFASNILPADMVLDARAYRTTFWTLAYSIFFKIEMYLIMLSVVVAGPGLISRDLRFNALPLYFSRPLTRLDYFLGKLGVIGALVAAVAVGPALIAYLIGVCFSFDFGVVKDTYRVLLASIGYGLIITLSVGTLMLALSSLSRRSLYVGIAWFGLWWISDAVAGILTVIQLEMVQRQAMMEELQKANAEAERLRAENPNPENQQARLAQNQRANAMRNEAYQRASERQEEAFAEAARTNWRRLPSYTANLIRLGEGLLDSDAAWVQIGRAVERARQVAEQPMRVFGKRARAGKPPPINERRLADQFAPQYPWWWSGAIVAGLMGISAWTLSRRVKSLDRLK
jgi:ABC-type transport system involved in multi-copper enzyme maturation permease subunit